MITPLDDRSFPHEVDEVPFTRNTDFDAFRATGYLADSEGRISCGRRIAVPRERQEACVRSHGTKITHVLAGSKKEKKNQQVPSSFLNLRTLSRSHRRRGSRGGKQPYPCRRWIQRIYSHTSHKNSIVSDINALEDLPRIMINCGPCTSDGSIGHGDVARLPMLQACPVLDFRLSGLAAPPRRDPATLLRSGMMPGDNDDDPTEPQDECARLMRILSALKEDYHMSLAQYQRYAPH